MPTFRYHNMTGLKHKSVFLCVDENLRIGRRLNENHRAAKRADQEGSVEDALVIQRPANFRLWSQLRIDRADFGWVRSKISAIEGGGFGRRL
jgi:hypothetical protein